MERDYKLATEYNLFLKNKSLKYIFSSEGRIIYSLYIFFLPKKNKIQYFNVTTQKISPLYFTYTLKSRVYKIKLAVETFPSLVILL